jgi:hypothetical protein
MKMIVRRRGSLSPRAPRKILSQTEFKDCPMFNRSRRTRYHVPVSMAGAINTQIPVIPSGTEQR